MDEDYDGEVATVERAGKWFRPVEDGDEIPRHCFLDTGELDTAALFRWLLPGLPAERAARLARKAEARALGMGVEEMMAFLEAEVVTWV
jgi:hypothetical protein